MLRIAAAAATGDDMPRAVRCSGRSGSVRLDAIWHSGRTSVACGCTSVGSVTLSRKIWHLSKPRNDVEVTLLNVEE